MRRWVFLFLICTSLPATAEDYCFGFLRAVPDRAILPESEASRIQKAHLDYMGELAKEKKLLAAGPLLNSPDIRGLLVYRCDHTMQAIDWANADPAVKNKRLFVEMYKWPGPPRIAEDYWKEHAKYPKAEPRYVKYPMAVVRAGEQGAKLSPDQLHDSLAPHQQHIAKFQKTRQVVWASRLKETKELIGLVFFREGTLYDARKIMEQDPGVQSKLLRYEIFEWMSEDLVMPW